MEDSLAPADEACSALAAFGVTAQKMSPIAAGRMNRHWLVETGDGRLVLRRYTPARSVTAIEWEHRLIAFTARRGWPVAEAMPVSSGVTFATIDSKHFALFPFLPGEPAPRESVPARRIKGRLLARLHDDLATFPQDGQRDGFGRVWELDLFVQPATGETFNGLLARFGRDYPEAARAVRTQRYRNLRELSRLGYGDLPWAIVHDDFHTDNLLFQDAALTGLLDFDSARWDSRAFDIAASLSLDCLAPPAFDAIEPRFAEAFLSGYAGHHPLDPVEAELLVPLIRAWQLALVALRLTQWANGANEEAAASIIRTAFERLPALEQRGPALTALARQATLEPR